MKDERKSKGQLIDELAELRQRIAELEASETKRQQAEEALRDSRNMLQTVLDSIPSAVFWKDRDSIFLGGNRTWLEAAGLKSSEEVVGKSDYDLPWEKKQADSFREDDKRVMESGIPEYDIIEPYLRADGAQAWARTNKAPLRDTEGNVVGILGTYEDITDRKRAEESLQQSEERFRLAFENANIGMCLVDLDGRLTRVNSEMCEIFGYSREAIESMTVNDLAHPEDLDISPAFIRRATSGEIEHMQFEKRYFHKQGHLVWGQVSSSLVRDSQGVPLYFISHVQDITERKRAEEALRESQQLLQKTFASLRDAVFIVDADTVKITDCNPAASEIFGYSRQKMLGRTTAFLHADEATLEEFRKHLYLAVEEKGFLSDFEFRMKRKDGTVFPTEHSVMSIEDELGKRIGWVSVVRDITERKRAEQETARGHRLLMALSQAAQAVQRARTPDEVYLTVGDEVTKLGYDATIYTLTEDRAHLTISYMTFEPALLQAAEKLAGLSAQGYRYAIVPGGIYDRTISEGLTVFCESTVEATAESLPRPLRPLAGRLVALMGGEQAIHAPLIIGDETVGLLAVSGTGLTAADVPTVSAFANQAAIALENARLFNSVSEQQQQLRALSARLAEAEEAERQRLTRELHDEVGQNLTALGLNLNIVHSQVPAEAGATRARLDDSLSLLAQTTERIRDVMADLRPPVLDDYGLLAALRWHGERFSQRTGITAMVQGEELTPRLPSSVETALFRIAQEALTNTAKHAQASQVTVTLEAVNGGARLTIADDGVGFDPQALARPGWGLLTMRERAEAVGGHLRVESAPGEGTRVIVDIAE